MTYLDYIIFLEKCDQQQALSGNAHKLYLKLLALCNALGWPAQISKSDPYMAAVCAHSINTMKECRTLLCERGMVKITTGGTGRNAATSYQLVKPSKIDRLHRLKQSISDGLGAINPSEIDVLPTVNPSKFDGFSQENPVNQSVNQSKIDTLYIDKEKEESSAATAALPASPTLKKSASKSPKKTGPTDEEKAALPLPHASSEFADLWATFRAGSKQAKKELSAFELMLKKLGKHPEAFAVVMLESAIQGDWSGIENPGTARAFDEWRAQQAKAPAPLPAPITRPVLDPAAVAANQARDEAALRQRIATRKLTQAPA